METRKDSEANRAHIKLENEKLRLEIGALERSAGQKKTDSHTWVSLVVSVVTAVAALTGLFVSIWDHGDVNARAAQAAHDQSLQLALSMATDGTAGPSRRISGIYQLDRFWKAPDTRSILERIFLNKPEMYFFETQTATNDQRSIASTLGALLLVADTTEDSSDVRCAAADVIGSAYQNTVGDFHKADDKNWVGVREFLFGTSNGQSWGVISRANGLLTLRAKRPAEATDQQPKIVVTGPPLPPRAPLADSVAPRQRTITCPTALAATKEAIRKSWNDLRNTNLQDTDLSQSYLYMADLHGSALMDADLSGADLRCSNLSKANLRGAKIEGADMALANIHEATQPSQTLDLDKLRDTRQIDISDFIWQQWKGRGFKLSELKELMGKNFPAWAASESEDFCRPYN